MTVIRVTLRDDGRVLEARGIDLPRGVVDAHDLTPGTLLRAVRAGGAETPTIDGVRVDCAPPGPGHTTLSTPATPPATTVGLLAAAARSRGEVAPQVADVEATARALRGLTLPEPPVEEARRALAEAGAEVGRLRERVATLRGRLQAHRETGHDEAPVATELSSAVARLSEAETERLAAEQTHEAAERRARRARSQRARRLRLQDRLDNLRRAARRDLAAGVHESFRSALAAVPGEGTAGDSPGAYEGDPVTAALAAARVADLAAPVVDATGRFPDAAAAADCLACPVVRWPRE